MPTRNISITSQQDAFVKKLVASGEYQNAIEAMRDALRALQERRREHALKLKQLRAAIQVGLDDVARGDYVEVANAQELHALLEKPARRRTRNGR